MIAGGDILDPTWMRLEGDFDEQVACLFRYVRLSREEVESFRCLFRDVENTLRTQWPGCEVIPFGSVVTGMGIKTSDVDCYVHIPVWYRMAGDNLVITARNILRRRANIFAQLLAIAQAKVPIVKFLHTPTRTNCDLSFKSPSGVRNSKLICYLLHSDRRALDLAILVKYWSKAHNLTGTNLMPNYALTLLVIFYLQHIEILPPVCDLQKLVPCDYVDNWNTAFEEREHRSNNEWSLLQILGGFFSYYSGYDFENSIVSPFLGYPIVRECFKKLSDVPEEFDLYKDLYRNGMCQPLKSDTPMCVQDPFDHSRNCTVGVFFKLSRRVCSYVKLAATLYESKSGEEFLRALLLTRAAGAPGVAAAGARADKGRNKVSKPQRNQTFKSLKKAVRNNVHALYMQINKKRGKR
ncbi:speckle targeted PIP5K1A-regulated poly(A) polymerase-like [Cydia amplana]|uniref:speckle targeted PIP5K1A-regulated poly(A) polymerase-like n=1 Tax=Cydia amplana TaxID=1869771 RepID=UPI002FE5F2C3